MSIVKITPCQGGITLKEGKGELSLEESSGRQASLLKEVGRGLKPLTLIALLELEEWPLSRKKSRPCSKRRA